MRAFGRRRKQERLAALDEFRRLRKIAAEDVTVLGEQVADLHEQTSNVDLDESVRRHYQQALDGYDRAKQALADAEAVTDAAQVVALDDVLQETRYQVACVLALSDGEPLPERRGPCFFNPQHGPARTKTPWTPPGGVEREIEICNSCQHRLTGGLAVDVRMIRVGDRYLPAWQAGSSLSEVARTHVHDGHTPETSRSVAEAHVRSGLGGVNGPAGPFGGGGIGG